MAWSFFCVLQDLEYTIQGFIEFRAKNFLGLREFGILKVFKGEVFLLVFRVQGLGFFFRFRVIDFQDLGFRVQGLVGVLNGFQDLFQGLYDLGFLRLLGLGFRVLGQGLQLRVLNRVLGFSALGFLG